MTTEEKSKWFHLVAPQVIALVVGAFAAFMTANVTLARVEQRTSELEHKVRVMQDSTQDERERLVRLETKIDIVLEELAERRAERRD